MTVPRYAVGKEASIADNYCESRFRHVELQTGQAYFGKLATRNRTAFGRGLCIRERAHGSAVVRRPAENNFGPSSPSLELPLGAFCRFRSRLRRKWRRLANSLHPERAQLHGQKCRLSTVAKRGTGRRRRPRKCARPRSQRHPRLRSSIALQTKCLLTGP